MSDLVFSPLEKKVRILENEVEAIRDALGDLDDHIHRSDGAILQFMRTVNAWYDLVETLHRARRIDDQAATEMFGHLSRMSKVLDRGDPAEVRERDVR